MTRADARDAHVAVRLGRLDESVGINVECADAYVGEINVGEDLDEWPGDVVGPGVRDDDVAERDERGPINPARDSAVTRVRNAGGRVRVVRLAHPGEGHGIRRERGGRHDGSSELYGYVLVTQSAKSEGVTPLSRQNRRHVRTRIERAVRHVGEEVLGVVVGEPEEPLMFGTEPWFS